MNTSHFGRFEVERRHLLKTVVASSLLVPAATALRGQRSARLWARVARRSLGMIERLQGVEYVDPNNQYVVAPLHEGFADALLLAHVPLDMRFVVRDELFEWKWLGKGLRVTDQIMVKPESRVSGYRQLLADAESTFARGQSLVMFPQGSILGIEATFQRGPFRIADRFNKSVLPVVITGTHRVWEHPYTDKLRFGQGVSMQILAPLSPGTAIAGMRDIERRMKQMALSRVLAPARRFDPERDGYWDDYSYEIDPDFPEVADLVARHRSAVRGEAEVDTSMDGVSPT